MARLFDRRSLRASEPPLPRIGYMVWVVLAGFLASCSSMPPVRDAVPAPAALPLYSLIFLIHGDADYAYHDSLGNARQADKVVVVKAQAIAEANPQAEVYIFHEMPRRHFLFVFPRRDGRAYHYRNGRLVAETSYWRDDGKARFASALQLYEEGREGRPRPPTQMLFYFGHELPEFLRAGYDASYPKRKVGIEELADGVRAFGGLSEKIDLLVLATCFGGTPHTIGLLAPYARYIIASPENLHLSYFDLNPLRHLDIDSDAAIAGFAADFAQNAFEQLRSEVQTPVSVVLYDTDAAQPFLDAVTDIYSRTLSIAGSMPNGSFARCDCAEDAAYASPTMSTGLTVRYRAPHFGRRKNSAAHSGWGCLCAAK